MDVILSPAGGINTDARIVAINLLRCENKKGVSWHSLDTQQKETGLPRRRLVAAIAELEAATGPVRLSVIRRCRADGPGRAPNVYRLAVYLSSKVELKSGGELSSTPALSSGRPEFQNGRPEFQNGGELSSDGGTGSHSGISLILEPTHREPSKPKSVARAKHRRPEIPIPGDFAPNETAYTFAVQFGFDKARVDAESLKMRLDAEKSDKRWRDWQAALRSWLVKAKEFEDRDQQRGVRPGQPYLQPRAKDGEYDWRDDVPGTGGPKPALPDTQRQS
ncbi:MAG TPA: hypothetical protein VK550_16615 [Polyangiaceae bacterium]|nr:hypothetical protein [Polyangiaceae bacterium]